MWTMYHAVSKTLNMLQLYMLNSMPLWDSIPKPFVPDIMFLQQVQQEHYPCLNEQITRFSVQVELFALAV